MEYHVIDSWNANVVISRHACMWRAGKAAVALDAMAAANRGMKQAPNRYHVTDETGDRLDL